LFVTGLFTASSLKGQTSGIWINSTSNSTWSNTANWSGGSVADGTDAFADFSTLDIAANRTVNLGANRTVGTLLFGDATTASNNWALANGAGGPWTLTLATSSATPSIQVVNQTATISALLSGTQGFTKSGAGVLTLSNAGNTISGGISLSGGTLNFASGALGTNIVTFTGNATLGWNGTNTQDISAQVKVEDGVTATLATGANSVTVASAIQTGTSGSASITKTGAGTLTFTAVNTYTGTTRISGGRIVLSGGNDRLAAASSLLLGQAGGSGILQLGDAGGSSAQIFSSIAIAGSGTANAIVGGNAAASALTVNNTAAVAFAGQLGGAGTNENNLTLTKLGAGTLTLSNAANSFTGDVSITGGALIVTKSTALGTGPKTVTISGNTNAPTLRLDGTSGDLALSADYNLITSNDNANNPSLLNVAGNNSIAGSISPTTGGFGGGNTRIKVNTGSLTLSGAISPHATASGPVTVIFDSASGTSGSSTGLLSDNGANALSLTKASLGSWSLSGANTHTGTTTINAGTLQIGTLAANGIAQPLGTATSAILIGSTSEATLEYTGSTNATLSRGITVNGAGGAVIANTGGALLTLSAVQSKGVRPLSYTGGSITVSGRITGTATTSPLTIDAATVRLSHNNNTYISPTVVQNGGTLIAANTTAASSATGTGSVTVDATSSLAGTGFINAGLDNSIVINGALVVGDPSLAAAADLRLTTSGTGSTILGSSSILTLDIFSGAGLGDNTSNAAAADVLSLFGALDIQAGATLRLTNPNNLTSWDDVDVFKLFDWTSLSARTGEFTLDVTDLDLPSGFILNTSNLYTLGTIGLVVPEPGRATLLLLSGISLLLRRRRVYAHEVHPRSKL
jgi:autotransporter-associated beta strand protein